VNKKKSTLSCHNKKLKKGKTVGQHSADVEVLAQQDKKQWHLFGLTTVVRRVPFKKMGKK
jgi:hypothetical protein